MHPARCSPRAGCLIEIRFTADLIAFVTVSRARSACDPTFRRRPPRHAPVPRLPPSQIRRHPPARRPAVERSPRSRLRIPHPPADSDSCWHLFPVQVKPERKPEAIAHFKTRNIVVGEHYPLALIEQKALSSLMREVGSTCQRAREFCHGEISLPIHPYLNEDETATVIEACNAWH